VQVEKAEAKRLHQEMLVKLEKEELAFVDANDTPSSNPLFAKVEADIAAVKRLLEEHAHDEALDMSFMQSWEEIFKLMPSKRLQTQAEPSRRGFWSRLWRRAEGSSV